MNTYDKEPKTSTITLETSLFNEGKGKGIEPVYQSRDIVILDNVLSNEECDAILRLSDLEEVQLSSHSNKFRNKYTFNLEELSDIITERCKKYLPLSKYIPSGLPREGHHNDVDHWYYAGINKAWRLVSCRPGSTITSHLDSSYVCSVDKRSIYTVMIYLSDNSDGATIFKDINCLPLQGRILFFNQDLPHEGLVNTDMKHFIRSEMMYTRGSSIETTDDKKGIALYSQACECHLTDPDRAAKLESEAFRLSQQLENLFYM
jgi:hypothetical protein